MKSLIILVLSVMGASLLEASTVEDLRVSFNEIGSDIDEKVKVLRAENGDAILEMNRKMLRLLGNYTNEMRDLIYVANTTIQLEDWMNENPDAQHCFDSAYEAMGLHAFIASLEIRSCAMYAEQNTSADAQYHFYSHAHYIMRAGTEGRGRVLESFSLHSVVDEQLEFLEDEQEWLRYLWTNYQIVLKEEVEGHDVAAEEFAEILRTCLQRSVDFVDGNLQNTKNNLEACIADVEASE